MRLILTFCLSNGQSYKDNTTFNNYREAEDAINKYLTKLRYIPIWVSETLVFIVPSHIASIEVTKEEDK